MRRNATTLMESASASAVTISSVKPSLGRTTIVRAGAAFAGFSVLKAGRISHAVSRGRFSAALRRTAPA